MKRLALILATAMMACAGFAQEQRSISETVKEVIMSRRSIRKYKPVPVGRDTLEQILLAGINAPSGLNKQSWEIRIVDNPQTLDSIKDAMAEANPSDKMARGCFRESPVATFIDHNTGYDCYTTDCGTPSE